ncbi:RDD family protein [Chitinophaga sp. 22321]|uniref:RDD family protein n=1 Tax=Chitinophaga hostae TaxID=2831022 RepID=A0ABS5IUU8_9BACT|nr:RDD family protein [Chitinophaga hostae]MBS0026635.1 RDD family protein [Chitinophaga hostae]
MADIKIPTSFNIDLEFESADIVKRFLAWLIDFAIRLCYFLLCYSVLTSFRMDMDAHLTIYMLLVFLPIIFYFPIMEISMNGLTPGKKLLHIQVVSMIGNSPGISQHLIRWIFRIIETPLYFMFLVPVVVPLVSIVRTPYNQRLGDVIAGTLVISTKRKGSIEETIFRDISNTDYKPQFPQIMKLSDRDMNKVKELLDRALKARDEELASKVAYRVKDVLHIESDLPHTHFLETVLNDYNYYTTRN